MTSTHRRSIERNDAETLKGHGLLMLWILTGVSGVAGLIGLLQTRETWWPRPLAFGWCAVFATGLVIELLRRRRAAR